MSGGPWRSQPILVCNGSAWDVKQEDKGGAMEYGKELLKGSTETLLLSLLKGQPMYGYQIIKELESRSGGYFKFREGTLYPALHRLEAARLVRGSWRRLPSGKERRYYELTEKGLGLLEQKVVEWQGFSSAVNLIMEPAS